MGKINFHTTSDTQPHPMRVGYIELQSTCQFYAEHYVGCFRQLPGLLLSIFRLSQTARHNLSLGMNAEGICLAEKLFGATLVNSDGKQVPVRYVGEQHVREDLGRIPTAQDWLLHIKPQRWMYGQRLANAVNE
jgi:hypothetical protein